MFAQAVAKFKSGSSPPEPVKVYEKILPGVWSLKGYFDLIDYKIVHDGSRQVFRYILRLSDQADIGSSENQTISQAHTRLIPSEVKKEVWKRDGGRCVMCGETKNLHFDHDLPFSKGGTSISAKNVRLLRMNHNLQKSAKIDDDSFLTGRHRSGSDVRFRGVKQTSAEHSEMSAFDPKRTSPAENRPRPSSGYKPIAAQRQVSGRASISGARDGIIGAGDGVAGLAQSSGRSS